MKPDHNAEFDLFLVEDVILTLGNIRGTLGWLAEGGVDAAMQRAGIERLDRQIAQLEQRAQAVRRRFGHDGSPALPAVSPAGAEETDQFIDSIFAAGPEVPDDGDADEVLNLFLDRLADHDGPGASVFADPGPEAVGPLADAPLHAVLADARALSEAIAALPAFRSRRAAGGYPPA